MQEVKTCQVYEDQQGKRWSVIRVEGRVARVLPDVGPAINVHVTDFLAAHRLVMQDGQPVSPPAPPALKVGDVVRLKCGGPPMVVNETAERYNESIKDDKHTHGPCWSTPPRSPMPTGQVRAMWHSADGEILREWFDPALLVPAAVAMDLVSGDGWADQEGYREILKEMTGKKQ